MNKAERQAKSLLNEYGINSPPVRVENIAKKLGLKVLFVNILLQIALRHLYRL